MKEKKKKNRKENSGIKIFQIRECLDCFQILANLQRTIDKKRLWKITFI